MKGLIAKALAFIMAFSVFVNVVQVSEVLAASGFSADPSSRLKPSSIPSNPSPTVALNATSNNISSDALLSWDATGQTDFNLTYFIEDISGPKKVSVDFKLTDSNHYQVEYKLTTPTGASIGYTPTFNVWRRLQNGAEGYIKPVANNPYATDLTSPNTNPLPNTINDLTKPLFTVGKQDNSNGSYGFSFEYDKVNVSFMWDTTNNKMYYTTDGLKEGYIYDFTLETFVPKTATVLSTETAHVLTKLGVTTSPTADGGALIDLTSNTDYTKIAKNVGIAFNIAIPKAYNNAAGTQKFVLADAHPDKARYGNITATINLRDTTPNGANIMLEVSDLLGADPASTILSTQALTLDDSIGKTNAGVYTVVLKNGADTTLLPGRIYGGSTVQAGNAPGTTYFIPSKLTPLSKSPYQVYTYPSFTFTFDAFGNSKIDLSTFNYPGWYRVFRKIGGNSFTEIFRTDEVTGRTASLSVGSIPAISEYYIEFSPNKDFTTVVKSQTVKHPIQNETIGAAAIFDITDTEVKYTQSPVGAPENSRADVKLWLKWDIGSQSLIDKEINASGSYSATYMLQLAKSKDDKSPVPIIGDIKVKVEKATVTQADGTTKLVTVASYEYTDFFGKKVTVDAAEISAEPLAQTGSNRYMARLAVVIPAYRLGTSNATDDPNKPLILSFPSVNYANIVLLDTAGKPIGESNYKSFTLSSLDQNTMSPPQDLKAYEAAYVPADATNNVSEEVSFKTSWTVNTKALSDYIRLSSLIFLGDAANPDHNVDVLMNLYLTQDEAALSKFLPDEKGKATTYAYRSGESVPLLDADGNVTPVEVKNDVRQNIDVSNAILDLQKNKIVRIEFALNTDDLEKIVAGDTAFLASNINVLSKLVGLDKNQRYFLAADIVVKEITPSNPPLGADALSPIAAITTMNAPSVPSTIDRVPSAPKLNIVEKGDTNATVAWDRIGATAEDGYIVKIEYQIIRTKDNQIDAESLGKGEFPAVYDSIKVTANDTKNPSKLGFETNEDKLMLYNASTKKFAELTDDKLYKYSIEDKKANTITDNSLLPNQLYFYYARTVKTIYADTGTTTRADEQPLPLKVLYSSWASETVTTSPVKAPKNLKLAFDENEKLASKATVDKKTQAIVSFDAPVALETIKAGTVKMYYQLKEEGKEWGSSVLFTESMRVDAPVTDVGEGYFHYLYKIAGLKPGKSYSMRVWIVDQTGSQSLFSNVLIFRTEMDQGEFDDETENKNWNEYLKQELEALLKNPYWTLTNTESLFEVIYRPSMFSQVIAEASDASIVLPSGSSKSRTVYYIPATALMSANDATKGFKISNGSVEVTIPPNALDINKNEALKTMAERIKNKSIADYYVKITVIWGGALGGSLEITDTADVLIQAVGVTVANNVFENAVLEDLKKAVITASSNPAALAGILDEIKKDIAPQDMIKYIATLVNKAYSSMATSIYNRLSSSIRTTVAFTKLDIPMTLVAKNIDQSAMAKGYQYIDSNWTEKEVVNLGGFKGMYADTTGLYGFSLKKLVIPGIDGVANGGTITSIVAKYGLDDFFGKDKNFKLEAPTTKDMIVGSMGAILGMPKGANGYEWLKANKGISVTQRAGSGSVSTQEAIFLSMKLFEAKSGVKVATVKIRNLSQTASITGIDPEYLQSVRAAYELGIYTDKNMSPQNAISIKDFLQLLVNINNKVKL